MFQEIVSCCLFERLLLKIEVKLQDLLHNMDINVVSWWFLDILMRLVSTQISNVQQRQHFTHHSEILHALLVFTDYNFALYLCNVSCNVSRLLSVRTKSNRKRTMPLKEEIVIAVLIITQNAWALQDYAPSHMTTIFEGTHLQTAVFPDLSVLNKEINNVLSRYGF